MVAVSLVVSGVLTGYLVRNLEFQNARDQLDRQAIIFRQQVWNRECASNLAVANGRCAGLPGGLAPRDEFLDRLNTTVSPSLNGDRLLLVTGSGGVVYDSEGTASAMAAPNTSSARVINRGSPFAGITSACSSESQLAKCDARKPLP